MATQSTNSPIQDPQIPDGDKKDVNMEVANEPIREDQVQNAVKFLSHPKVRGSPIIHRRSFLEKKGLTKEEIDEAFRRVPDPASNVTSIEAAIKSPASQPKESTSVQPQTTAHAPQLAGGPSIGAPMIPRSLMSNLHWYHALLAIGVLSASGAGTAVLFKKVFVPRVKAWIRKIVAEGKKSDEEAKPSSRLNEEAAEAAKVAASAADVIVKASQELLSTKHEERKYFEAFMGALDSQVKEMKSMSDAIRKLESRRDSSFSQNKMIEEQIQSTTRNGSVGNPWRSQITPIGQTGEKPPGMKAWDVPQPMQQRPIYATQSQSSDEDMTSEAQDTYATSSQTSDSWWRKKTVINETEPRVEEPRQFQRGWVAPPQPAVFKPEAAAAIRHRKTAVQKQQSGDVRSIASSDDGDNGAQKTLEFGVDEVEASSSSIMGRSYSEIQEERSDAIEVK